MASTELSLGLGVPLCTTFSITGFATFGVDVLGLTVDFAFFAKLSFDDKLCFGVKRGFELGFVAELGLVPGFLPLFAGVLTGELVLESIHRF